MRKKKPLPLIEYNSFEELAAKPVESFAKFSPQWSENQVEFINKVRTTPLVFCSGPAGTGKTTVACFCAAEAINMGFMKKIVLVRPMVECGRSIGFSPGTEQEKIAPWMRPFESKLAKFIDPVILEKLKKTNMIEFRVIDKMRGDEFENSVVILDEAQNLNVGEMKMFVTRLGKDSRMIVCGDSDQVDIFEQSGFNKCFDCLKPSKNIGFVKLTAKDIFRHDAVAEFLKQYK